MHITRFISGAAGPAALAGTAMAALLATIVIPHAAAQAAAEAKKPNPLTAGPVAFKAQAPETFKARFETSKGDFVIEVVRAWAPNGADRFYNLVKNGFFDEIRFFRVVPNFVVQWGIPGDPAVGAAWRPGVQGSNIPPDPVKESNKPGTVTFAMAGRPDTRSTQLFINLGDNAFLDQQGFAPIGRVIEGMDVVKTLNGEYADTLTSLQGEMWSKGNAFLKQRAPNLDYIKKATVR